jgi:thymidylate synthase (FAD)
MWRGRAVDKKQGSSDDVITDLRHLGFKVQSVQEGVDNLYSHVFGLYEDLLEAGVAPEQARIVLPLSMMTSWWWSGSLDAFANMCKLRLKEDTQYETRLVAQQISEYMSNLYPVSWGALINETD